MGMDFLRWRPAVTENGYGRLLRRCRITGQCEMCLWGADIDSLASRGIINSRDEFRRGLDDVVRDVTDLICTDYHGSSGYRLP